MTITDLSECLFFVFFDFLCFLDRWLWLPWSASSETYNKSSYHKQIPHQWHQQDRRAVTIHRNAHVIGHC